MTGEGAPGARGVAGVRPDSWGAGIRAVLFSSESFIVFSLTFRPLIHFEFIFVYGVRKCSNFVLLHKHSQNS